MPGDNPAGPAPIISGVSVAGSPHSHLLLLAGRRSWSSNETSSMFTYLLLGAGLASSWIAGSIATRAGGTGKSRSTPSLTLAALCVIVTISVAQLTIAPALFLMLMRHATLVRSGEVWRLASSLAVQDGGWSGAAFNLAGLAAIGVVTERTLGRRQWLAVAVISVATAQLLALRWEPVGAGNSILNFGLAGGISAACLAGSRRARVPAAMGSACFVLLLATRDIHGVAGVTGMVVEFLAAKLGVRSPGSGSES